MNKRLKALISVVVVLAFVASAIFVATAAAQNAGKKGKGKKRQAAAQQQGQQPRKKKKQQPATQPSDRVYGVRMTEDEGYHTAPAAAETANGVTHLVWIQYVEGAGDTIATRSHVRGPGKTHGTGIQTLSSKPGQFIRPVLAASGDELACFWTETAENNRSCIWTSRFTGGKWTAAERLLPNESHSHQNPEVAGTAGGKFAVVYQIHNGKDYDLRLQQWDGKQWTSPVAVSEGPANDWDPVVTFDAKKRIQLAWSEFSEGDYDVIWRREENADGGKFTEPKRISARGEYDMHPWLAPAQDGSVWVSWDVVRLKNHGYSGGSTITGANKQRQAKDDSKDEGAGNHWSGVAVRVIDDKDTVRVPGDPRGEIVAPQGYVLAHRSLGKIAVNSNGEPWVVYRALMKPIAGWSPSVRDGYLWELIARPFRDGKWGDAVVFDGSDGYLEEPALAVSDKTGITVAFTSEHRHAQVRNVEYVTKKPGAPAIDAFKDAGPANPAATKMAIEKAYDHHHDFDGLIGWHGDVYLAQLPQSLSEDVKVASLPEEAKPQDRSVDPRQKREAGRHEVQAKDGEYKLLWGDLHRHSNVSRCSVGNEPNPEDLYRYGMDINLYDFFGLSDHAEYTTDYYWWRQQKVADLFHIPGVLSVLYNVEWSMQFPQGHTNTIFATRHNYKMNAKTGATNTLLGGWEFLRRGGFKAITIPHTPADPGMGTTWPNYDPQYERLCEIFQACRGSYEYDGCPRQHVNATNKKGFYWLALEKGYRLGIVCSSDHGYGCAYACVYAKDNTRDSVWQALYDRRTYGSTTYGLVMDVRTADGHWMGEEFTSADAPEISAYIRGTAKIRSIDVIGGSKILHTVGGLEKPIGQNEYRLKWSDPEWSHKTGEQWYYVRVIQEDDEMAWSSPMWVTPTRTASAK
jgi:hypothetical protein